MGSKTGTENQLTFGAISGTDFGPKGGEKGGGSERVSRRVGGMGGARLGTPGVSETPIGLFSRHALGAARLRTLARVTGRPH